MNPDIILFDEPTSALDPEMVQGVLNVMKDVAKLGITMIVVTHEMNFARDVANKVVFMADGVVKDMGDSDYIFNKSQNERLKKFLAQ
jgi:ABC-type polar amino acid transport system ATPase subunit